jgi:hypothetical protein
MFVVGATCGEAMLPIAVGMAIDRIGLQMLPISIFVCSILLVLLYTSSHLIAMRDGPKKQSATKSKKLVHDHHHKINVKREYEFTRRISIMSGNTDWTDLDDDSDFEGF